MPRRDWIEKFVEKAWIFCTNPAPFWVYFAENALGNIKIAHASDPRADVCAEETAGAPPRVRAVIGYNTETEAAAAARWIRKLSVDTRIGRTPWFAPSQWLRDWIEQAEMPPWDIGAAMRGR